MQGQTPGTTVLGYQNNTLTRAAGGTAEDGDDDIIPLPPTLKNSRNDDRPQHSLPFTRAISPASAEHRHRLFQDPDSIKSEVLQSMLHHPYDVKEFYKERGCWQFVARSQWFENFTLAVIFINALWIGVDTDYNKANNLSEVPLIFQITEHTFGAYFLMEWIVRFMAFKWKRNALNDCWFMFDSLLVLATILDTWIMQMLLAADGSSALAFDSSNLRVARLLRLVRVTRIARLMRVVPEIMIMVKGMATATRSVFFTLLLVLSVTYVFAITLTHLTAGTPSGEKYFTNIPYAMFTITMHCTLLDSIERLMLVVMEDSPIAAIIVMLSVFLFALTFMNLLVGILCEVVSRVSQVEQEANAITFVKGKLQRIVEDFDTNGDNMISKTEFDKLITHGDALKALREIGVDPTSLIDIADVLFETEALDDTEHEAALSFPEFMEIVLEMRGANTTTVRDIVLLKKFIREIGEDTNKQIQELQMQMNIVSNSMNMPTDKHQRRPVVVAGSPDRSPLPAPRRISVLKTSKKFSSDSNGSSGLGQGQQSAGRASASHEVLRQSAGVHQQRSPPRGRSPDSEQEKSWQLKRPPPVETGGHQQSSPPRVQSPDGEQETEVKVRVRDQLSCLEADMAAGLEQLHRVLREVWSERSVMLSFPGSVHSDSSITNPALVKLAGAESKGEVSCSCSSDAVLVGREMNSCTEPGKPAMALMHLSTLFGGFEKATKENLYKIKLILHECLCDALAGSGGKSPEDVKSQLVPNPSDRVLE
eukprot:TRINITY_DN54175_c0_g1_i1.p1 TRINITY_DN54175_c0_g1~~TRINITY_DN54175_c0_g1_i1.p1  ORF type:complete len:762 (+),score=108.50 TRINITY_DN54175_c0_g1_i1:84-2369(+)